MKILKIREPIIKNDIDNSILLAILDDVIYNGFLYNYFIQIIYDKKISLDFINYDYFFDNKVFVKKYISYPLLHNLRDEIGLINYFKFEIERNRYVISHFTTDIIIGEELYHRKILIYGYDDSSNELYIALINKDKGWIIKKISYNKYIDLIQNEYCDNKYCNFDILYHNKSIRRKFSKKIMIKEVKDYSKYSENNKNKGIYGIEAFFNDIINDNNKFQIDYVKSFNILFEQKDLMTRRIEFLVEKKYIDNTIIELNNSCIKIIKKLFMEVQLYYNVNILNQKELIKTIEMLCREYIILEHKFVNELIKQIHKKVSKKKYCNYSEPLDLPILEY